MSDAAGPATTVARAYDGYGQALSETVTVGGNAHSSITQRWDAARRRTSLHETSAVRNNPLFEYRHRADGLLTAILTGSYPLGTVGFDYADTGLLIRRSNTLRTQTINTRDDIGRILQQATTVNNIDAMVETMSYRDDGTLATYGVTRNTPNIPGAWNETRSYAYDARGQVTSEGFSPAPATSDALAYVFDSNTAGLGVRTDARVGAGAPAAWQSSATTVNTLARVTTDQTNGLGRDIPTSGVSLGANYVELFVNGSSRGRAHHPGWADNTGAWSKTLSLDAGSHTLTANAVHPSGHFTASANSTFTVNVPVVTLTTDHDADGNVVSRTWSNGTTQLLTWDAFNRLIRVSERDSANNGYDWSAVYDAFGRRLKTTQQSITANTASGTATVIASTFDPQVEFLEVGVAVNGVKAWKVYGPDLNGVYGSLNGTGGLEATILDADGTVKAVITDTFGNGVATVTGTAVTWSPTRVGGYGPLPNIRAEVLTDVTRLAEATAWRGRRIDPTGFYNLGARYYEPTSGRFLSPDPLGHGSDMSLYAFANGDPINGFDPDGRFGKDIWGNPYPEIDILGSGEIRAVTGWRSWMPFRLQGMFDEARSMIAPISNGLSYNLITGHRVSTLGADPGISRDYRYLSEYQKGGRELNLAVTLGGLLAPEAFLNRFAVTEGKTVTVLGSMKDVAPYANRPGFNVLDMSNVPKAEWSRVNAEWLNKAVVRGDDVWLVTDPVKRSAELVAKYGTDQGSAYFNLELPMLEQYNGMNVIKTFPVGP